MRIKLKDAFELQIGKTPSRNKSEYWNGVYKWVSISDIGNSRKYVYSTRESITDKGIIDSGIKVIPKGTVIMSFKLSIGKTAITTEDMYTNEAIVAFIDKKKIPIDIDYLYYLCSGSNWMQGVNKAVMGLTLNKATLSEKEINIPNIEIQKKCAGNLDKIDRIIDLKKQQLDQLDLLVRSLFIEMFGDPISNSKKWTIKRLVELSILITNGTTPSGGSENYIDSGVVFLRSQNVWKNRIDLEDTVYISSSLHKIMNKSRVIYNDILITKTGRINTENSSLGRAAIYKEKNKEANINGHVYLIRLKDTVNPEYILSILTGEAYREYIRRVCVGGIDKRQINLNHIEDFPIIVPPLDLQNRFAEYVSSIDKSKLAVKKSLEELEILKKSLMQKYFA